MSVPQKSFHSAIGQDLIAKELIGRAFVAARTIFPAPAGPIASAELVGRNDSVVQRILRHRNLTMTWKTYVKTAPRGAIAAIRQFSEDWLRSACAASKQERKSDSFGRVEVA